MIIVMYLNTLSGHLEIIRRHPPLAAELARRFTDAPLPDPAGEAADMVHVNMSVPTDTGHCSAVEVAVRDTPRSGKAGHGQPVTLTVLDQQGTCRIWYRVGEKDTTVSPVVLGPGSGPDLADGSPWLTVFAAALGAVDLLDMNERDTVLAAIDATGCGAAGITALSTEVMRAASPRAREKMESDMGTGPCKGSIAELFVERAFAEGYALGLQEGRTEASILKVLSVRGIAVTAAQARRISTCGDLGRLHRWLGRALTAATTADVLEG